jgi:parallel beta-helix repeat protein
VVTNNICKSEAGTYAGISLMIDGGVVNLYTLVHGNHFYGCSPCIRVAAHYNQISNNVANNSNFGLYVDGGNYNVVRDNDISAAGGGIVLKGFDGRSNPDYTVVLNNKCTVAMLDDGTNTTNRGNKFSTGPINGTAVLVGGTVTVNTAEIVGVAGDLPNEYVILSRTVTGGTPGHLSVGTITAGASFVINSSSATDTSTIYWEIQH